MQKNTEQNVKGLTKLSKSQMGEEMTLTENAIEITVNIAGFEWTEDELLSEMAFAAEESNTTLYKKCEQALEMLNEKMMRDRA